MALPGKKNEQPKTHPPSNTRQVQKTLHPEKPRISLDHLGKQRTRCKYTESCCYYRPIGLTISHPQATEGVTGNCLGGMMQGPGSAHDGTTSTVSSPPTPQPQVTDINTGDLKTPSTRNLLRSLVGNWTGINQWRVDRKTNYIDSVCSLSNI